MIAENPAPRETLLMDNWIRGFIVYTSLGILFGAFAIEGSFWGIVKFTLILFPLLSILLYFVHYRTVINKKLRTEGKTTAVATRETEAYAARAAVVVLLLFPTASIIGAWSFSEFGVSIAVLFVLLSAMIMAYLHANFMTPVDIPRYPWRISKHISQYVQRKNDAKDDNKTPHD
jgi:membrane protein implicated in regulation of membrane protease activity